MLIAVWIDDKLPSIMTNSIQILMLQMEYQIKLKAADAKPANASGITSS
jgi:hypothetical protein